MLGDQRSHELIEQGLKSYDSNFLKLQALDAAVKCACMFLVVLVLVIR